MPKKYRFSAEADADIEGIIDFTLEGWGAAQADRYIDGLEAQCELLAGMPGMGTAAPHLGKELRCFPYKSHVIYYRPDTFGIYVIAVLHERQDPTLRPLG